MDLDWSESQPANQQRFLMSAIHTVGETGFLLEASGCVHLAKIYQVKWDTYDEIVVGEEEGFWVIILDVSHCTWGLLVSSDHTPFYIIRRLERWTYRVLPGQTLGSLSLQTWVFLSLFLHLISLSFHRSFFSWLNSWLGASVLSKQNKKKKKQTLNKNNPGPQEMAMLLWGAEQYLPSFRGILEFEMHLKYREDSLLKMETLWPPRDTEKKIQNLGGHKRRSLPRQMWQ